MEIDSNEKLRHLIQAQLDQRLTDDEFEGLQQYLDENPDARAEYVELARLDAGLRDAGSAEMESDIVAFPTASPKTSRRWLAVVAALVAIALFGC